MKVMKFGGSSVGSPERIRSVVDIVASSRELNASLAVVVSAFEGVTNQLLEAGSLAGRGDARWLDLFGEIRKRHADAVGELLSPRDRENGQARVQAMLESLSAALHEVFWKGEFSALASDRILSFGEQLSAAVLSEALKQRGLAAEYLDAREIIRTDDHFGHARVYLEESYQKICARWAVLGREALPVVTGFIGATAHGEITTLGRGGSDYTAAILGAALEATEIEIWTDVDGVLTADPKRVRGAFPVPTMTYEEAMEMAHFGAKVIYPLTVQPARHKGVPIRIKNTFNPAFPGTVIRREVSRAPAFFATGISSMDGLALLGVQGAGMIGVAGIAARLFGALARKGISVILITQASSEHSICLAVEARAAAQAKSAIEEEFREELNWDEIDEVVVEPNVAIVAVVGENMRKTPGVAGKVFGALGRCGVNVVAIAQGSSELNISIVVLEEDEGRALNVIHEACFSPAESTGDTVWSSPS